MREDPAKTLDIIVETAMSVVFSAIHELVPQEHRVAVLAYMAKAIQKAIEVRMEIEQTRH